MSKSYTPSVSKPKKLSNLVACATFALAASGELSAQNLFYDFNNCQGGKATQTASTGSSDLPEYNRVASNAATDSFWTTDGLGVTGQPGDFALNLDSATGMGSDGKGGVAVVKSAEEIFNGAKSFTICGWFKSADMISNGARLMVLSDNDGNGFLLAGANGHLAFQVKSESTGGGIDELELDYSNTNEWVFFAVTLDSEGRANNITFYKGTQGEGLSSNPRTIAPAVKSLVESKYSLTIGNSPGYERPLKGQLDNIAVYVSNSETEGALSEDAIRAIFEKTLKEMSGGKK